MMKKRTKIFSVLITAVALFVLTACGGGGQNTSDSTAQSSSSKESGTITITDHADNKVTVPKDIKKIAVCDILPLPSVLSVFFDSADSIAGMSQPSMAAAKNGLLSELYPEILDAKTDFINGTNVNVEELKKLDPDVVFYSAESTQLGKQLTDAGFAAVAISASKWDYDAVETLNQWISLLSKMFPANDRGKVVEDYSKEVYDRVQERVSKLSDDQKEKVFFLFQYDESTLTTSGNHFFGQYWADAIGAINAGEEVDKSFAAPVNMEQIYKWNPDHILITNFNTAQPDDLYNNTIGSYDWSQADAVKNKKVDKMPLGMYRSYTCGVDTPVTLLWLAKTVYPDEFEDIDITQETKDYYKKVFDIDLTDEQAEKIFKPASDASAF